MPTRVYRFESPSDAPRWWCVPGWHAMIVGWDKAYGLVPASTTCNGAYDCNEDPEAMRGAAEQILIGLGLIPLGVTLPIDAYTLARNIHSEFGEGTPEERVAVAFAGLNRYREEKAASLTAHLLGTRGKYGDQIGTARPASTKFDPNVADLLLAFYVFNGWSGGWLEDPTLGATHFFDRVSQDAMNARDPGNNPPSLAVYNDWVGGGDYLTWVGHVPNVRPHRLALFKRRYELAQDPNERAVAREAGWKAITGQNRAPRPLATCPFTLASAVQDLSAKIQAFTSGNAIPDSG